MGRSKGGGAVSGASAPSAGGSSPSDTAYTSVEAQGVGRDRAQADSKKIDRGRGRGDHFVPVGPDGATVSGRHWYSTTVPLAVAALLASGVKALLTAVVRAALHQRSASYVSRRCHSPPQTWLLILQVRAHRTHAPSAEADVTDASNQQSTAAAIIIG